VSDTLTGEDKPLDARTESEAPVAAVSNDPIPSGVTADRLVAFLDLGTNSIRLLVVRFQTGGAYSVVYQEKETVRLGEGEFRRGGRLQPAAMRRAGLVCARFVAVARSQGASEIVAVATSATREAANRSQFTRYLLRRTGVDVHVISGPEEARLIYLGVVSGLSLDGRTALFIDIGGGSTEFIVGTQTEHLFLDSVPIGAIRVAQRFFPPDDVGPVSVAKYARIRRFVSTNMVRTFQSLQKKQYDLAIASSGTAMNLAEVAMKKHEKRSLRRGDVITRAQIRDVVQMLCGMSLEERRKVPGLNPERADIIIAGAAILETIVSELDLAGLLISDRGLREGMPVDYLTQHAAVTPDQFSFRERSVLELGRRCGFDEPHARQVALLAWQLFDSGREMGLHRFGELERELLEHAALLHDVGTFVSYNHHRGHSYYLIMNAELLGFHQRELAIIANLALYHHKAFPRPRHPEFKALDKPDRQIVRQLCVLLRIAESLDRGHMGAVREARLVPVDRRTVALEITPASDCHLEIWELTKHEQLFQTVFERELVVKRIDGETNTNEAGV
jgi:exopolyphosphatase/guanosine-5'-triphosphate,3'-diphosphate pyrophosphatase